MAGGHDSLLVLTGVTGLEELVAARRRSSVRRTSRATSAALADAQPAPGTAARAAEAAGRLAGPVEGGQPDVSGEGDVDDWWRAVAVAAWEHLDTAGGPAEVEGVRPAE